MPTGFEPVSTETQTIEEGLTKNERKAARERLAYR